MLEYLKDDFISPLIFKNSVEGILVTSSDGLIVQANPSCLKTFGYSFDELIGQPVEKLLPGNLSTVHLQHRKNYVKNPQFRKMASGLELIGLNKVGNEVPLEISLSYVHSKVGLLVICFIVDISNSKKLERELKKERKMIQQYLEVTSSIFLILNKDETIAVANKAAGDLLGVSENELKGMNWFDEFIPESERENVRSLFHEMIDSKTGISLTNENLIINAQGEQRLIEWHNTVLKDRLGMPDATLSSGVDITEKRALEKTRKEALVMGQENERRRIAQELHDGLGQSISAINLNLNALEPELEGFTERFKGIYSNLKSKLNETIEEVRSISRNLTPRILEDFGLGRALEYLCDTIDKSTQVKLNLSLHGDLLNIDQKIALGLYRIIQELVNNALHHANPKNINVHVTRDKSEIIVLVEDDGGGFDPNMKFFGLGLSNMQSRVEVLNGQVEVDSNDKSGTTISITIPI
ncbi:PAS domain-containing sensor histidine kinase [Roseivirga echinicomitans]|uniref:Oxygen sensor histidine kinase NreB n=1 Tax=Roseivirga echinicomitans TaxID=296218 RepID=A0A150XUR9_9BACT|nr:PAS domain S-box protein [Roseivirga echinicomitans]KYG82480.1 hypothetical protein AWN68_14595 [Roseivirga echinicomitans]